MDVIGTVELGQDGYIYVVQLAMRGVSDDGMPAPSALRASVVEALLRVLRSRHEKRASVLDSRGCGSQRGPEHIMGL
jgi:hypothetical protein